MINLSTDSTLMKYFNLKFLMVFLTLAVALPAMAQISGDDYYRVRNASTGKYIAIANDKFNYTTVISTAGGGLSQFLWNYSNAVRRALICAGKYLSTDIHMVNDPDIVLPGALIYAVGQYEDSDNDNDYNLIGQGTSLLTLTSGTYPGTSRLTFSNRYINIKRSSGTGVNTLYTASIHLKDNSGTGDLGLRYFVDDNGTFAINESSSATNAKWYVEKVTHFNVQPEVELNGKWYTTLKVPFAFTLSGSVEKAYAITAVNGGILAYQEITGTIPAGTPVLLQCSSPNAADCQLIPTGMPKFTAPDSSVEASAPVADESSSYTGTNLLGGTYYCNTDGNLTFETKSGTSSFSATDTTAASGKFVIGKDANGKLGFIAATGNVEGNVMPANKAWLTSAGLFPTLATPKITPDSGTFTSAQTVTITADEGATIEYSTDGGNTWQTYSGSINVDETTTIQARAIKQGLYNNSNVATAQIEINIPNPVLTASPTSLTINDLGGSFTVEGTDLGTDNVGVTSDVFSTTTSDQTWGFNNNNGSVNGTVTVTYQGRELNATGTVNVANNMVSTQVNVTYQTDIYIVTDNGVQGNWNFSNGTQMANEDGTYTATFNATLPNTFILFARKLGDGENWNTRYVFGPSSDGDWAMPGDKATEYGNIDVYDDDPIKLPYAGEYTITINGNDKTFTITRTIETVATPTITPASGTYTGTQTVTIECETQDATILYKIDDGDYQPYNGSIEVAESCTITAKATKDGWNDSEEATTEYIIEIPVVHQPGDVNHDGEVNIKDVTDLIDYLLGMNDNVCTTCADVKADGDINISDVTTLIDMLLGI